MADDWSDSQPLGSHAEQGLVPELQGDAAIWSTRQQPPPPLPSHAHSLIPASNTIHEQSDSISGSARSSLVDLASSPGDDSDDDDDDDDFEIIEGSEAPPPLDGNNDSHEAGGE